MNYARPTYEELEIQIAELKKQNANHYYHLFENSLDGFAYCEMIYENNVPTDFRHIDVNPAFERLTQVKNAKGLLASELLPDVNFASHEPFRIFSSVATTGLPTRYEDYIESKKLWLSVSITCPKPGFFITIIEDITFRKRAELAIKESTEKFRLIFENTAEAILFTEPTGNIVAANHEAERILGYSSAELIANGRNLVIDTSDPRLPLALEIRRRTGQFKGELNLIRKNGEVFTVEITSNIFTDSTGKELSVIFIKDISERKKAEKTLKESEEKYRMLFENINYGFQLCEIITDENNEPVDFRFLETNRYYKEFNGYSPDEIKNKTILEIIPHADVNMIKKYGQVALTGTPLSLEYYSNTFHKNIRVNAYSPRKGQFACVFEDITDQIQVESKLLESNALLYGIFEQSPYPVWISDKTGVLLRINKACLEMLKISEEDVVGKYNIFNDNIVEEQGFIPAIKKVFEKGDVATFELVYDSSKLKHLQLKNFTSVIIHVTVFPIINDVGEITNAIIHMMDITDRKVSEEELLKLNLQLKDLNETKDKLYSIIAHDLRSPFNGILGFSDLLLDNFNKFELTKIESIIRKINSQAAQTLTFLDNLLSWTKAQTGQLSFNPQLINLEKLVSEIIEVLNITAIVKDISLSSSISDELNVYADLNMLKIILQNLISNAIKFTKAGGSISINANLVGNNVEISVLDDGIGMKSEILKNLFNLNAFNTTIGTANEKGSGLGLILCKDLIERLGGNIIVKSDPGLGSEFIVTLPKG